MVTTTKTKRISESSKTDASQSKKSKTEKSSSKEKGLNRSTQGGGVGKGKSKGTGTKVGGKNKEEGKGKGIKVRSVGEIIEISDDDECGGDGGEEVVSIDKVNVDEVVEKAFESLIGHTEIITLVQLIMIDFSFLFTFLVYRTLKTVSNRSKSSSLFSSWTSCGKSTTLTTPR
jgi:hypothetical protein